MTDNLEARIRVAISALEDCNEYFADEPSEDVGGDWRILSLRQDALSARSGLHAALRSLATPSGAVVEDALRELDYAYRNAVDGKIEPTKTFILSAASKLRASSPSVEPTVSVRCIEAREGDPDGVCLCDGPDNCWDRKPTVDERVEGIIAAWKKCVEWTNDDLPPESSIDDLRERLKALLSK